MSDEPVPLSDIPLDSIKTWLGAKFSAGVLMRVNEEGRWSAWYWGLTHEEAAKQLYAMGDEVVKQHIPLPTQRKQ